MQVKACTKCGGGPLRQNPSAKSGLGNVCDPCHSAQRRQRYAANREKVRTRQATYYRRNAERIKAATSAYRRSKAALLRAERAEERAAWLESVEYRAYLEDRRLRARDRASTWYRNNPERARENGRNRRLLRPGLMSFYSRTYALAKRRAVPPWADLDAMRRIYELAGQIRAETGEPWHVDHIVPLQHPLVCGLHCHTNLQILPARINLQKGNRCWPGGPL